VRRHLPHVHIDVVEIDPVVAELAQKYMGFTTDPKLHLHIADGRRFVLESREQWDIIVLDAYGADNIPYPLVTRPFLEGVRARLADGGLVVANLWGEAVNDLFDDMLMTYDQLFAEVHVMAPRGSDSRVVLAFPTAEGLRSDLLEAAGRRLRKSWGLRFDLPTLARESYLPRARWPRGGMVLEDRP
jgi:spermidine synthase